jgi:hypothetical protein
MAFFMDMADNGGREAEAQRDESGNSARSGQVSAVSTEDETPEKPARYARRLDLTA